MADAQAIASLAKHYPHRDELVAHAAPVLQSLDGRLRSQLEPFVFDDGREQVLFSVTGVIPVQLRGNTYNCPLVIWFPLEYPKQPPLVFVVPTSTMQMRPGHYVDPNGVVSVPYLQNWNAKSEGCSLGGLIEAMQAEFSVVYPLTSRRPPPRDSAASPPLPRPPVHLAGQPPPPPPALPAGYAQQTPTPPMRPPPAPAFTPVMGPHGPVMPPAMPAGTPPFSLGSPPPQFAAPVSTPPVHSHAPATSGPPLPPVPHPQMPPPQVANGHRRFSGGMHAPQYPPSYAQPPVAPQHASPQPRPPQFPPHMPPQLQSQPRAQALPRSHPQPPPQPRSQSQSQATHAAQPNKSLHNFLDDLDADEATGQARSAEIPHAERAPRRPVHPEVSALRARLHAKLSGAQSKVWAKTHHEMEQFGLLEQDLVKGNPAIVDEMQRLEAVKSVCDSVRERYRGVITEAEARLRELERRGSGPEVDEIVCSSTIVYNQLLDVVAEDAAIEDTIYHLGRGLNCETARIDLDKFLKKTRTLARQQFLLRALENKILAGLDVRSTSNGSSV